MWTNPPSQNGYRSIRIIAMGGDSGRSPDGEGSGRQPAEIGGTGAIAKEAVLRELGMSLSRTANRPRNVDEVRPPKYYPFHSGNDGGIQCYHVAHSCDRARSPPRIWVPGHRRLGPPTRPALPIPRSESARPCLTAGQPPLTGSSAGRKSPFSR